MVQHFSSLDGVNLENTWLTIGSFDGVHIGHQQLIRELNNQAHQAGAKSVVLTFHPHPAVVLRGKTGAFYLTSVPEKVKLLDELGTDIVISHPFTFEISQSKARDFVVYLLNHLGFQQLWVGNDFALGKGREGNTDFLARLGNEFRYKLNVFEPIVIDGQKVSSSLIRSLLTEGNIVSANRFLGRPYSVAGDVVHGDGRGKSIGIPTANLDTGPEKLIPAAGVYACKTLIDGHIWPAAVNLGVRPTFQSTDQNSHVEAHIVDYSRDMYNEWLSLEFLSRLRGEQRFQSVDELINQVHLDINTTREILINYQKTLEATGNMVGID
jgi:riboflavin kinase / FMN adenylyltransferase